MTVLAHYIAPWNSGGASILVNVSTLPPAGSAVYVAILFDNDSGQTINSVAGLGATWSLEDGASAYFKVYKGVGATSSGNVTATFAGAEGAVAAAIVTQDVGTAISVATARTVGTGTHAGPAQTAGPGQVVFDLAITFGSGSGWPVSPSPATGWTALTSGPYSSSAYRVPTQSASHQLSATTSGGGNHTAIGQVVIGTAITHITEVMADSPWGLWLNDELSGTTLADASGNSRPMTTTLTPTLNQPGPVTGMRSIQYTTVENYAGTAATLSATACTIETWVYIPAAASASLGRMLLVGQVSAFEGTSGGLVLGIEGGDLLCLQHSGNGAKISSPVPIARDQWHHVVGSIGAAGMKLRVNKVTRQTGAATANTATALAVWQRGNMNLSATQNDYRSENLVNIGPVAVYASQLSDARTDAHYDASGFVISVPSPFTGVGAMSATAQPVYPEINDPRDISGLIAWYSAESITGLSDNTQMDTWPDLSGNDNHAIAERATTGPFYRTTGGPGGGPSVQFSSSANGFRLPAGLTTSLTAAEIRGTVQAGGTTDGLWGFNPSTANMSHLNSGGDHYESFGTTVRKVVANNDGPVVGQWIQVGAMSKANRWTGWYNHWQRFTTTSNTVGWPPTSPVFGKSEGTGGTGTVAFTGRFTTLVFYDRELTDAERGSLQNWMENNPSGGVAAEPPPEVDAPFTGSGSLTAEASVVVEADALFSGSGALTATSVKQEPPGPVLNAQAVDVGQNYVTVTWDPPVVGGAVEEYWVSVEGVPGTYQSDPDDFEVTYSGLAPDTAYVAKVVAVNSFGTSVSWDDIEFTTESVPAAEALFGGSGELTATTLAIPEEVALFTGSGSLTALAQSDEMAVAEAPFAGSGALSADVSIVVEADALFGGSGSLTAEAAGQETAVEDASFTGSGSLTADVTVVVETDALFGGSGSLTAESETDVVCAPIDLATYIDLYDSMAYSGTYLVADPAGGYGDFTFELATDPAETYTLEVEVEVTSSEGIGYFQMYSLFGPSDDGADDSGWYDVHGEAALPMGTQTLTFDIGPGIEDWNDAVAAGEHYLTFSVGQNLRVHSICVTPALIDTSTPPEPPVPELPQREGGRDRTGSATVQWTPAVIPPPIPWVGKAHLNVKAYAHSAVTMVGTQPKYTSSDAVIPRLRTRILVGGKDVSFLRGVPTPEPPYQLTEPLLWGPSGLAVPQIAACFEVPGEGDLKWCAKGKPVIYQRVDDDGVIHSTDYRGFVIGHDVSGVSLVLEVGGHAQGRAALRYKPGPIFRDTLDMGRLGWAAIHDMGLSFEPRLGPTTGMKSGLFGDTDHLSYISELCARAWKRDGTQWTIMPDDDAVYSMFEKDTTTTHITIFTDAAWAVPTLYSDLAEETNEIYATGVTPGGQRVRFGEYPGLEIAPAPPYPFDDERVFGLGTTDAETDTGDGITVMLRGMWVGQLLSLEEMDGTYDADVTRALMSLQADAGITPTGNMGPNTWKALFDLETTGFSTRGARVGPAAQTEERRRFDRAPSGRIIRKNPGFKRHVIPVGRAIDFGSNHTRHRMKEWSEAEIARFYGKVNWTGTIKVNTGAVLAGRVEKGATVTPEMLVDVRDIKPGMNAYLPMFAGIDVHVSVVDVDYDQDGVVPVATLSVDTQARDALEVWEIIQRNRESRRDPARRLRNGRASSEVKDSIVPWDEVGGVLRGRRPLEVGWNIVRVVGAQEGQIGRLELVVQTVSGTGGDVVITPRAFACAVFGRSITAARLNHLVPAPLTEAGSRKWEDQSVRLVLDRKKQLYSAGTFEEPCGYSSGRKTKGDPLTGWHVDKGGFRYESDQNILYVAIWVGDESSLLDGRIMWPQLEAGA